MQVLAKSRLLCQALTAAGPRLGQQPAARVLTSAPVAFDDSPPSDTKQGQSAIVDPEQDGSLLEVLAVPMPKPLIPGSVPMYVRITDKHLIDALRDQEMLGQVRVAAFARQGASSTSEGGGSGSNGSATDDDNMPTSDHSVPAEELEQVGTLAQLKGLTLSTQGDVHVAQIGMQGQRRITRLATLEKEPLKLQVRPLRSEPYNSEDVEVRARHQELVQTLRKLFEAQPLYVEQLRHVRQSDFQDKGRFADLAVGLMNGTVEDNQAYLNELSVPQRLLKAIAICKKELELISMQKDISRQVEEKFTKEQKRYFLTEQMKHIQKELGITKDEKSSVIQKFQDRFGPVKEAAPDEVCTAVEEELGKLRVLDPASSEYNVTRNYLDWLTSMPWGIFNEESFDVAYGRECLDRDHYGLQDVKDRILEFIAVGKLNDQVQGKIVCLVGPPGVGKTSIGKSIAESLGRKFYRFSVGGLSDVAEIKGHRRTYVGAMPGKLVQCLKQVQSSNPMVLIDEVDKLGRGFQGDPASALLELLDPEQNGAFRDHYLDVPLDLSKVLFMCTANVLDTIPRPLLDRMEVIELSGYTEDEKRHIARRYLEREVRKACAIPEGAVELTDGALELMIKRYCRESGVRNLKKQLEKAFRKAALALATSDQVTWEERPLDEEAAKESTDAVIAAQADDSTTTPAPTPAAAGGFRAAPMPHTGFHAMHTAASAHFQGGARHYSGAVAPPVAAVAGHRPWRLAGPHSWLLSDSHEKDGNADVADGDDDGSKDAAAAAEAGGKRKVSPKKKTRRIPHYTGDPIVIDEHNLDTYLGKAPFDLDRFYKRTPIGTVMGLAWTSMGGSTLYVESNRVSTAASTSEPSMTVTGQLGEVFKESLKIAHTYARHLLRTIDPDNAVLEQGTVHLHVPQGAVPKDGPSAGATTVSALLSLGFGEPVIPDVAMTGEISLSGRVLPIGGVKEKTLAAKRSQVATIIFPAANQRDWEELDAELRSGLDVVFAEHYVDLLPLLFPGVCEKHAPAIRAIEEASQAFR